MNTRNSMHLLRKATASALLATLLLVGCGGEKPETMLAVRRRQYLAKNDHKAAAIQLKNALQQDPQLAEARFLLGQGAARGGDPTGAEVELRKAQGLNYPADR
jgi:Tfp pilus assembly protein PilF